MLSLSESLKVACSSDPLIGDGPQITARQTALGLTEQAELLVMRREVCSAYTGLNSPIQQPEAFKQQARATNDDDVHR